MAHTVIDQDLLREVAQVAALLMARGATIGFAESCTGGQLAGVFARHPGVSAVFRGAVVAYDNDLKREILRVQEDTLARFGAVSKEIALQMAQGGRQVLGSTYVVSVTGIAGPTGGTPDKPVGTVCFALVGPEVAKTWQCRFAGDRTQVQLQSVRAAVEGLFAELSGKK